MSRFLEALHSGRVLLMDGAMGTELIRAGLNLKWERCEQWNRTHPEKVQAIHRAYGDAGAALYVTNTFRSHADFFMLVEKGLVLIDPARGMWQEECRAALACAQEAGGNLRFVLGSVGPLGPEETPRGVKRPRFWSGWHDEAALFCAGQIDLLAAYGVDAVLLETQSLLALVSDILEMAKFPAMRRRVSGGERLSEMPLLLSFAFRKSEGRLELPSGHSPEHVAEFTNQKRRRVAALGVNCGQNVGLDDVVEILHRYRRVTDLPVFARPNAGTPTRTADGWEYPLTPEKLAARLPELLKAGIAMFGGCCGTTPAHIAACRPIIDEWNREHAPAAEA